MLRWYLIIEAFWGFNWASIFAFLRPFLFSKGICPGVMGSKFWLRNTCEKVKLDLYNWFLLQNAMWRFYWVILYFDVSCILLFDLWPRRWNEIVPSPELYRHFHTKWRFHIIMFIQSQVFKKSHKDCFQRNIFWWPKDLTPLLKLRV